MSRDKSEAILKLVVKHFFMEKEVTSTLVMDSLYSGLKALEFQSKNKKGLPKLVELEELPHPMVRIDKDMFVLADDVIMLLERAVSEPLPHQPLPPKDDKSSQNRTKVAISFSGYFFSLFPVWHCYVMWCCLVKHCLSSIIRRSAMLTSS